MGKFAQEFGKIDIRKELGSFKDKTGVDTNLLGLGVDHKDTGKQMEMIQKLAGDKKMTWLERFSAPFKAAFNAALVYEKKRQIGVIGEFFDDMVKVGHTKIKLYVKQPGMDDHFVEYDDCGQKSMLNGTIAINGKTNQMKAKFALEAMKNKGFKTITIYLKTTGMKDHYVELNENGKKIPFLEKVKEL